MEHGNQPPKNTESTHSLEPADINSRTDVRVHPILEVVHLGETRPNHFTDVVQSPVPEAGISVRVWQNSVGTTGIEAAPLGNNRVETADVNDTGDLIWRKQLDTREAVEISSVWGNVGALHLQDLTHSENIGNAGIQWGVVRVTSQDGTQNHFLVAAEFSGVVDDWNVRASLVAIAAPHTAEELKALQVPKLPPA